MYEIPKKTIFKVGEVLMNVMFIAFSVIFIALFISNLKGFYAL